jgi:hypothetical protein
MSATKYRYTIHYIYSPFSRYMISMGEPNTYGTHTIHYLMANLSYNKRCISLSPIALIAAWENRHVMFEFQKIKIVYEAPRSELTRH